MQSISHAASGEATPAISAKVYTPSHNYQLTRALSPRLRFARRRAAHAIARDDASMLALFRREKRADENAVLLLFMPYPRLRWLPTL